MKKAMMYLIGALMIFTLTACTPTADSNKIGEVKQTEAQTKAPKTPKEDLKNGVAAERGVDTAADELTVVSVYTVKEDEDGLKNNMESVKADDLSAEALVNLLIQYGVLEKGTEVLDFDTEGTSEAGSAGGPGAAGPGGASSAEAVEVSETGVLDLNQIVDGGKNEAINNAVAKTIMENLNVKVLTIKVNGETVAEGIALDSLD